MERRGSGFKKICNDYVVQFSFGEDKDPVFYSDYDCFILTLKNLNYSEKEIKRKKAAIKNNNSDKNTESNAKTDNEKPMIKSGDKKRR